MELQLYDTLTRKKRPFQPIDPARVRMYVCGPTVYDYAHIGNARPVIVFDVLYRLLRHLYGEAHVKYVRNITDVDDKINARAAERGIAIRELTEETYKNFKADVAALGCLEPSVEPRATEHIEEMKAIIERLVASKHAYVAEGHVLFSVPSMKDYGKLSNRSLDEMIAGARVEVAPYKKDSTDFVLWKPSKDGEPAWASPAGITARGRPGWHIECSAMSWKHLGETFDIHGGGIDLVFPHHENEVAQSRCAFDTGVMTNYWMHNGFLQVEGEKMSKSLGNFLTIQDQLDHWGGAVLRLNMLKTNYRQPIDWTQAELKESGREVARWNDLIEVAKTPASRDCQEISEVLSDDLNTHAAITLLRGYFKEKQATKLRAGMEFLGIKVGHQFIQGRKHKRLYAEPATIAVQGGEARLVHSGKFDPQLPPDRWPLKKEIWNLLVDRHAARAKKDFKESDRIRDELAAMGVVVKDSKDGTTWEIAR